MSTSGSETGELLPCPFCGRQPVTERTGFSGRALYIYCINDDGCPRPKAIGETEAKATEVWNTRAQPQAGEADEIKKLRRENDVLRDAVRRREERLARHTPSEAECDQVQAGVNTNQPIFDAITAATRIENDYGGQSTQAIIIDVQKFIEAFNGHRDRKLCTSLDQPEPSVCDQTRGALADRIEIVPSYTPTDLAGHRATAYRVDMPNIQSKDRRFFLVAEESRATIVAALRAILPTGSPVKQEGRE